MPAMTGEDEAGLRQAETVLDRTLWIATGIAAVAVAVALVFPEASGLALNGTPLSVILVAVTFWGRSAETAARQQTDSPPPAR